MNMTFANSASNILTDTEREDLFRDGKRAYDLFFPPQPPQSLKTMAEPEAWWDGVEAAQKAESEI